MPHIHRIAVKVLQTMLVVVSVSGCTTAPDVKTSVAGDAKMMDMNSMKCHQEMMKNMSSEQMKMMQGCMGDGMIDGKGSTPPVVEPQSQDKKADAAEHAKHHPAQK